MDQRENKIYSFKNITISLNSSKRLLPTSATMRDGMYLEDSIGGYRTLTVEGKKMFSIEVEQQEIRIGSITTNQKISSRTLRATCKLEDRDSEKLQSKFKELLSYLYRDEDVEIRSHDELDSYYYGRYASTDTVPGDSNSTISSFGAFCTDPLKYTEGCISDGYTGDPVQFPITPRGIEVTLFMNSSIKVTNGEQNIAITDAVVKTGDVLTSDFPDEQIAVNGEDCIPMVDLGNDFESSYLRQGQKITSNNGKPKIFYRGATI